MVLAPRATGYVGFTVRQSRWWAAPVELSSDTEVVQKASHGPVYIQTKVLTAAPNANRADSPKGTRAPLWRQREREEWQEEAEAHPPSYLDNIFRERDRDV